MKYVLYTLGAAVLCGGFGVGMSRLVGRRKNLSRGARVLLGLVFALLLLNAAGLVYLGTYMHAQPEAKEALRGNASVTVSEIQEGWMFDGPGGEEAMVFFPGAKVDEAAYAPLLLKVAEKGIDCFALKVPFHMAVLGTGAGLRVMQEYEYESWILAGHSLGGVAAASLAGEEKAAGLVLLASYPTSELPENLWLLSVFGSEDGVLEHEVYEEAKRFWPPQSRELILDGGNHAQFGDYGRQSGDRQAQIAAQKQWELTAGAIAECAGR